MKTLVQLGLVFMMAIFVSLAEAQEGSYFAAGWSFEKFVNTKALQTIVADFNEAYSEHGNTLSRPLEVPGTQNGIFLGVKYHNEMLTMGIDIHGHSARSLTKVTDSLMNWYERQLKVSHSGFSMGLGVNIIHTEGFRMGPVFNLGFEQFQVKTMGSSNLIEPDQDIPVDAFYLSTIWKFPVSIGGEGFTFDLIPYFQLPFYKINLEKLNTNLNRGFAKPYTKDEMKMSAMSYGLIVTLNFRLKRM